MPEPVLIVLTAALGLVVGSFLNVCIHRLPAGRSVVHPRSACPSCSTPIRWYDNVPVLSYLVLGGRCRACRARIGATYPAVELVTAALFVWHVRRFGIEPLTGARLVFACAMVVLFVIDLRHRILPNRVTLPGIIAGLALSVFLPPGVASSALGVVIGGGVLLAVGEAYYRVRGEEGLGMGDVKMLAMIGAFLGWKLALVTLVLSSLVGSIVGVVIIVSRQGDLKYALPFGTFLAVAAVAASLTGEALLAWYLGFY